ncbi:MAG: hypothetical protein ACTSUT_19105 [Promethearchaeota archaeon]
MSKDRLKEFFKKIHDSKNSIPLYISIIIRPGKNILDFKIKKEGSNILRIIAHDEKQKGWFLHSYHIPINNLGLNEGAKNKEILTYLSEPYKITGNKATKDLVEDLLRKYIEILPEKKKHYFVTQRFKKKKEIQMGMKMKGF